MSVRSLRVLAETPVSASPRRLGSFPLQVPAQGPGLFLVLWGPAKSGEPWDDTAMYFTASSASYWGLIMDSQEERETENEPDACFRLASNSQLTPVLIYPCKKE